MREKTCSKCKGMAEKHRIWMLKTAAQKNENFALIGFKARIVSISRRTSAFLALVASIMKGSQSCDINGIDGNLCQKWNKAEKKANVSLTILEPSRSKTREDKITYLEFG